MTHSASCDHPCEVFVEVTQAGGSWTGGCCCDGENYTIPFRYKVAACSQINICFFILSFTGDAEDQSKLQKKYTIVEGIGMKQDRGFQISKKKGL